MMKNLQLAGVNTPIVGSLEAYISYANQIPLLTQQKEHELAMRLQLHNDLEAAKQLILAHLGYVVRVAKNYLGYGLPLADLIQEGNMGLMKAVKRFNPEVGVRLVTFAMHWIKAEIHEYILRNWRIVKIATTKAQRKLFFNLRRMKKRWEHMTTDEVNDVAKSLGVKPAVVREMEMRLAATDTSFDLPTDDSESSFTPVAFLEDHRANPEQQVENAEWSAQSSEAIYDALNQLDLRSQEIIRSRWLNDKKLTLQELANKYKVSAERIRQLEKNAMSKLRVAVENTF